LTQIGKFGIGFKSVYAYTQTPEVHCEGINFKIEHFVRPYKIKEKKIASNWTTLFVLSFASTEGDDLSLFQQTSFEQISNRLQKLSVRTLLFLRNLEEIEYTINNTITGYYWRNSESEKKFTRRVTVMGQQGKGKIDEEKWIVFSRPISGNRNNLNTEIAFKIRRDKNDCEVISKLKQSYLNVFFPTEKETHLGFLVQGPYRTTPARDNIPQDDQWNKQLVKETAKFLQMVLEILKEEGLLTVELLETLPLRTEEYSDNWMFWPIYKAAKQAFNDNAFLPTADKSFVKAPDAKLARGKGLRALIDNNQLTDLINSDIPLRWLSGEITRDLTPDLRSYIIHELDVEEIDPENFARKISYTFLKKQSDDWHIIFYDFLRGQEALWRKGYSYIYDGSLRQKSIIRCNDGENRQPYDTKGRPLVFLPVSSEIDFPMVKPKIYANEKAKIFLDSLGLVKPDICATVINVILSSFENDNTPEEINIEQYQESINLIEDAIQVKESPLFAQLIQSLQTVSWILAKNLKTGQLQFKKASEIYVPNEELYMYFDNNEDIWFVSNEIQINEELLLRVGVANKVKIQCRGLGKYRKNPYSEINLWSRHGSHGIGLRCFDHNTSVDGLKKALESITTEKAIYIWNTFAIPLARFIIGEIKTATRQDFSYAKIKRYYSDFGSLVTKCCWVPTTDGTFKKPAECYIDDLHQSLVMDEQLTKQLGISHSPSSIKSKADAELHDVFTNQGISMDVADFLINNKKSLTSDFLKEALTIYQERQAKSKPIFPTRKSGKPYVSG
jgi:hypothetical protein